MSDPRQIWLRRHHCAHSDFEDVAWGLQLDLYEVRKERDALASELRELRESVRVLAQREKEANTERSMAEEKLWAVQEERRWVSVGDRLPADGTRVLVHDGMSLSVAYITEIGRGKEWFVPEHDDWSDLHEWPFWMPMPEPPEVKTYRR